MLQLIQSTTFESARDYLVACYNEAKTIYFDNVVMASHVVFVDCVNFFLPTLAIKLLNNTTTTMLQMTTQLHAIALGIYRNMFVNGIITMHGRIITTSQDKI